MSMKAQAQGDNHMRKRNRSTISILPIIVGVVVFLCTYAASWILLWMSENKMPKGGVSAFIFGYFVEGIFQIIPFVLIGYFVKGLIRKKASKAEIYVRLAVMLIPVSVLTAYWLFVHIDPFARGALLFINTLLVVINNMVGSVIYSIVYGNRTKDA